MQMSSLEIICGTVDRGNTWKNCNQCNRSLLSKCNFCTYLSSIVTLVTFLTIFIYSPKINTVDKCYILLVGG